MTIQSGPAPNGVLDANGVIGLAKADVFPLIERLFQVVFVPAAVVTEVTDPLSQAALQAALLTWLAAGIPTPVALQQVPLLTSEADRHVLALVVDHPPAVIITGDRGLSYRAKQAGLATISAPRIIELLAVGGLIAAARPHLDQMMSWGFGITSELYAGILRSLGEL